VVPWDWLVLDVSYVMVLVGGGMVLRARAAMPMTWLAFALISVCVGGFLFAATVTADPSTGYLAPATSNAIDAMRTCS
jgi:hypothetical protein